MSIRELYQASRDAADKSASDNSQVQADRDKLAADQQAAIASDAAAVAARSALADGTPEGQVFPVDAGTAVVKLHGSLEILPIGDPDAE